MEYKLQTLSLSKSFLFKGERVIILEELGFELQEGEFISIVGPSGCGKSTFLELLAGITKPDPGNNHWVENPSWAKVDFWDICLRMICFFPG